MKLLLTADLHSRLDWLEWLGSQQSDLIAVAGDLIEESNPAGDIPQIIAISEWCKKFPGRLALSSGNHDALDWTVPIPPLSQEELEVLRGLRVTRHWMDGLERDTIITDSRSVLIDTGEGEIVVTTIPFHADREQTTGLWEQGSALRESSGARWLVLNHEPPAYTSVGGRHGSHNVFHKVRQYSPTYLLCGHIHYAPYYGSFAQKMGTTWCFNAGYPTSTKAASAPFPNHIVISHGVATWRATGLEGIIEKSIKLT